MPPIGSSRVKRVAAGGSVDVGDAAASGDFGSLLAQMDLTVRPGKTLLSGSAFSFTVPKVGSSSGTAFTSIPATLQCYFGASYTDPASTPQMTMRDRYYRYLEGTGTLASDNSNYSEMFPGVTATTIVVLTTSPSQSRSTPSGPPLPSSPSPRPTAQRC
jgi:hypothetical protein